MFYTLYIDRPLILDANHLIIYYHYNPFLFILDRLTSHDRIALHHFHS